MLPNHFLQRFSFLMVGLLLFFVFARSKNTLSRLESMILLGFYCCFIAFELFLLQ